MVDFSEEFRLWDKTLVYQHMKTGRKYRIMYIAVGSDSADNIDHKLFVVYTPMEPLPVKIEVYKTDNPVFVRTIDDFFAEVTVGDYTGPRFKKIGILSDFRDK